MTGYRVHFVEKVDRPVAYCSSAETRWMVIHTTAKGDDNEILLFFKDQESFDQAIFALNAEVKETLI